MDKRDLRRELVQKAAMNVAEDILKPLERDLASIAEQSRETMGFWSSGHLAQRVELFIQTMRRLAEGILDSYLRYASTSKDFTKNEVYDDIASTVEAVHRMAIDDINRVGGGGGLSPGSALAELERRKAEILSRAERSVDIAIDGMALEESTGLSPPTPQEVGDQVFVIMSLAPQLDPVFNDAIKPAIEATGFRAYRVDREEPVGSITEDILRKIESAPLIVGDLTLERCNCYYELGYARGLGKRVILTARNDHDPRSTPRAKGAPRVHFDLDAFKISFWSPENLQGLRVELEGRIRVAVNAVEASEKPFG